MVFRRLFFFSLALGFFPGFRSLVLSQDQFYRDKTIRIVVGFSPGGGFDTYARLIARHLGRHIPGNPSVVVDNMPGAGSLISANHIYRAAKPDGLTIGHFIGGLFLQQILGKPGIEFDARQFEYVGAPVQDHHLLWVAKSTGITGVQQWLASKKVIKFGGVGFGGGTDDIPAVVREVMGLPIQLVSGYKGTTEIRLAFNNGEIQGIANSWEAMRATWSNEVNSGQLQIIMQMANQSHPELTQYPLAGEFVKTEDGKKLLNTVTQVHSVLIRPYVLPPNTPKDRVQILRKAFQDTMKSPELRAESEKGKLDINPVHGEQLAKDVLTIMQLEPALAAKLKEILK